MKKKKKNKKKGSEYMSEEKELDKTEEKKVAPEEVETK